MTTQDSVIGLEEIFLKYGDFVYHICFRYFRNESDAEDISQEVFLKLHKSLPNFRGGSTVSTWIYRIAANCCIDALRSRKQHLRLDDLKPDKIVANNLSGHEDASLARIDLSRILAQTDARTREILFLALAEGCTYEEVAEVVGMSRAAVAKIVTRFREKILARKSFWFGDIFQSKVNSSTLSKSVNEKKFPAKEAA